MRHLLLVVALCTQTATATAWAEVALRDRVQTVVALKSSPACCVVDARSQGPRTLRPLTDAVVWGKDLRITPSGTVVVIADNDQTALAVARQIERRFKAKDVVAVKGGFDVWRDIQLAAQEPGMPATFVIPMNTCEQGKPLQTLRSNKR